MQSTSQRRRWNNRLILGVLVFMVLLNLPTLIKTYLLEAPTESEYPYLLAPQKQLKAIYTSHWSLTHEEKDWVLSVPSPVKAQELAVRWQSLTGTQVPDENYQSLKSRLTSPSSIEVWYEDQEEPDRITFYQLPQFWLLQNWQGDWIAVTVDKSYLFPTHNDSN